MPRRETGPQDGQPHLLHELLDQACARHGDRLALTHGSTRLTWSELDQTVGTCTGYLHDRGVRAGDRVVYAGDSDHRFVAFFYATSRIGAIFVPVHPDLTAPQLSYIAGNCQARLVICRTDLGLGGVDTVSADAAWGGKSAGHLPQAYAATTEGDVGLLIYTSGTTGHPKGVVCPHRQVLAAARAINACLDYRSDDVVLCRLPLSFDYGLYQLLLSALSGAAVVLAERTQDFGLLQVVQRHGVTVVPLVPSLAQMLNVMQRHRHAPTTVRLFTNTGARLGRETVDELLRHFPDAGYASMYGMTECKRISILEVGEYRDHPDSVGLPIPGATVRVVGPDGREAASGTNGEIVVGGATVMAGYWGVPMEDQSRYRRCPSGGLEVYTGDQGHLDTEGRLYFVGRHDDIIKRCGIRVSLTEIENAAELVPGVAAAVAVRPDREDGELHLAVVSAVPSEVIRSELATRLDRARMPSRITSVDVVPLTPNGKPDRAGVAHLLAVRTLTGRPTNAPPTESELHDEPLAV